MAQLFATMLYVDSNGHQRQVSQSIFILIRKDIIIMSLDAILIHYSCRNVEYVVVSSF